MSDNGKKVWFHSGSGAVFQLDVETGVAVERIGRTPLLYTSTVDMTPGSATTIRGLGLSSNSSAAGEFPLPLELGGTRVRVKDLAARVTKVTPTEIAIQVPWETPASADYVNVEVDLEPNVSPFKLPPFSTRGRVLATREAMVMDSDAAQYVLAVHEDWSELVSAQNPARPGEVVHLYGTGFGKVMETPPNGMPPATGTQSSTVERVNCRSGINPINVFYSGLAPGTVGYYQIDIRVPEDAKAPSMSFNCSASANEGAGAYLRIGN